MKKLEVILPTEAAEETARRLRGKVQALSLTNVQEWREEGPTVVYRGQVGRSLFVPAFRLEAVCFNARLGEVLGLLREGAPGREVTVVSLEDVEER